MGRGFKGFVAGLKARDGLLNRARAGIGLATPTTVLHGDGVWRAATAESGTIGLGTQTSSYQGETLAVADGDSSDFNIEPETDEFTVALGIILKVAITSTVSGTVTLELYEDAGRSTSRLVKTLEVMANYSSSLCVGFSSETGNGILYATITNDTGAEADFTVDVEFAVLGSSDTLTTQPVAPALATDPGLELSGGNLRVKASTGIVRDSNGISVDPDEVMLLTTDQTSTGKKRFDAVGVTQQADPGAPTAGAWLVGDIVQDDDGIWWRCTVSGSPGTWVLHGDYQQLGETLSFGTVAAGDSADAEVTVYGRHGMLRLLLWGDDAATSFDVGLRIEVASKEDFFARDVIWRGYSAARKVVSNADAAAAQQDMECASLGSFFIRDMVRLDDGSDVEFNRVSSRNSGPTAFSFGDELLAAMASGTKIMLVTELNIPWFNDSATPAEARKLFIRVYNEHASQDVDIDGTADVTSFGGA